MELKINSEYKSLMPELPEDEYESLKQNISKNGYWEEYPVVVNDKYEILDGHTRWKVCQELGIQPTIKIKHFESKEDEMEFVIEANLSRRHLNSFQKAEIGLKLLEIEKAKAEKRKLAQLKQFKDKTTEVSSEDTTGKAINIVADKLKISRHTIEKAKEILEKGDDELIEKCRQGEVSVAEAYRKVKNEEKRLETFETSSSAFDKLRKDLETIPVEDINNWIGLTEEYIKNMEKYASVSAIVKLSEEMTKLLKDIRYILINHLKGGDN